MWHSMCNLKVKICKRRKKQRKNRGFYCDPGMKRSIFSTTSPFQEHVLSGNPHPLPFPGGFNSYKVKVADLQLAISDKSESDECFLTQQIVELGFHLLNPSFIGSGHLLVVVKYQLSILAKKGGKKLLERESIT